MTAGPTGDDERDLTEELLEQGDRLTASSKELISELDQILRRRPRAVGEDKDEERRPGLGRWSSDWDRA